MAVLDDFISYGYAVDANALGSIEVDAYVVVDGTRTKTIIKKVTIIGFSASEIILRGECEYGTFYDALNVLMLCLLIKKDHKDHSITQHRLWTENPTVAANRI